MCLCLKRRELDVVGRGPEVYPRRHLQNIEIWIATEQQLRDNLLRRHGMLMDFERSAVVPLFEIGCCGFIHAHALKPESGIYLASELRYGIDPVDFGEKIQSRLPGV